MVLSYDTAGGSLKILLPFEKMRRAMQCVFFFFGSENTGDRRAPIFKYLKFFQQITRGGGAACLLIVYYMGTPDLLSPPTHSNLQLICWPPEGVQCLPSSSSASSADASSWAHLDQCSYITSSFRRCQFELMTFDDDLMLKLMSGVEGI